METPIEMLRKDAQRIDRALRQVPTPGRIQEIFRPPLHLRLHYQREGIRLLQESIDLYQRSERQLNKAAQARLNELLILREQAVMRLAEMRPR